MAKSVHDDVLDAALEEIATATTLTVCSAEPADFSGIAAVALAETTLSAGAGNGDYTIADGDTSGRKVTVAEQADINVDSDGDASHIVLDDGATMQYVTTCTSQTLTSGNTVTVPSWDIEIADPS